MSTAESAAKVRAIASEALRLGPGSYGAALEAMLKAIESVEKAEVANEHR